MNDTSTPNTPRRPGRPAASPDRQRVNLALERDVYRGLQYLQWCKAAPSLTTLIDIALREYLERNADLFRQAPAELTGLATPARPNATAEGKNGTPEVTAAPPAPAASPTAPLVSVEPADSSKADHKEPPVEKSRAKRQRPIVGQFSTDLSRPVFFLKDDDSGVVSALTMAKPVGPDGKAVPAAWNIYLYEGSYPPPGHDRPENLLGQLRRRYQSDRNRQMLDAIVEQFGDRVKGTALSRKPYSTDGLPVMEPAPAAVDGAVQEEDQE